MSKQSGYARLDPHQIHQQTFDEPNDAVRVTSLVGGEILSPTNPIFTSPLPFTWDYVSLALSVGDTVETYTFRFGNGTVSGAIVGYVVITYSDSTRELMLNCSKTAV